MSSVAALSVSSPYTVRQCEVDWIFPIFVTTTQCQFPLDTLNPVFHAQLPDVYMADDDEEEGAMANGCGFRDMGGGTV